MEAEKAESGPTGSIGPTGPIGEAPPRAFTQGVGTVFQFTGTILFIVMMTVCCGSALLSKETAERHELREVGWGRGAGGDVAYSAQQAVSASVVIGLALGIAVASVGLGLQATRRLAAHGAVGVSAFGLVFWMVQLLFFGQAMRSIWLAIFAGVLAAVFGGLLALAIAALQEMLMRPPPAGHEVLPPGYKVPYSWYHEDPPEVRLERELADRRRRLEVERKELEMLEERIRERATPEQIADKQRHGEGGGEESGG